MKKLEKLTEIIEKMSPRKLLLLCGSAALAVFLLLYVILSALFPDQNNGKVAAGNVTVVEAVRDIAPQTVLTDDMLKTVEVPANLVPAGALTDKKQALGKKTGIDLFAGDILTERKLTSHGGGFVGMIPDGMRAVSFGVNDVTGVSGFAKPGDKVDILLVTDKEGNGIVSKTLLKDVLILAVNKSSDRPQGTTTQTSGSNGKQTMPNGSQPTGNTGSTGSPAGIWSSTWITMRSPRADGTWISPSRNMSCCASCSPTAAGLCPGTSCSGRSGALTLWARPAPWICISKPSRPSSMTMWRIPGISRPSGRWGTSLSAEE